MLVLPNESHAPKESIALVKAAADFLSFRSTSRDTRESLRAELVTCLKAFWPSLDVYVGNTHFRLFLDGRRGADNAESVYVEWRDA